MNMEFIELNGNNRDQWENFVSGTSSATIFHTLQWKGIIEETYGFAPRYFLLKEGMDTVGVLPLFHIKNLRNNKLVSLPFSMYGGPILKDPVYLKNIMTFLAKFKLPFQIYSKYDVTVDEKKTIKNLANTDFYIDKSRQAEFCDFVTAPNFTRRNINKNKKLNIDFQISQNTDDLYNFYDTLTVTRKRQGSLVPSIRHIRRMFRLKPNPHIFLCRKNGRVLSTMLCLQYKDNLYSVYSCGTDESRSLGTSDFLFYKTINYCMENRKRFYFGGASNMPGFEGLLSFKKKWRSIEEKEYLYANYQDNAIVKIKTHGIRFINLIPDFIYTRLGHYIIKYFY